VSLLYLCLAERLNLPLSIVTPPGHIFVRYKKDDVVINIETTARGIHLDSEHYLNLETKELEERTLKETIGFAHVNEASVFLQNKEYKKALKAYKKAKLYAPKDKTLNTILGLTHILLDEEEEGERLLKEVKEGISSKEIIDHTLIDDYFNGETSKEGIALLFLPHEKGRESILKRKTLLEEHLKSYPRCRTTLFGVATCWLELHREKEALEILKEYHKLDPKNLTVEYYLSSLYLKREDLPSAWKHYKGLKALCDEYDHNPKVLKDLFKTLKTVYPNS
jgi:tetratricopeptide (TPR) repeat protein